MRQAADEYRSKTDTIVGFIEEMCVTEPEAPERVSTMYAAYGDWCREGNRHPLARARFKEHLLEIRPELRISTLDGYPVWRGIRLRTPNDAREVREVTSLYP